FTSKWPAHPADLNLHQSCARIARRMQSVAERISPTTRLRPARVRATAKPTLYSPHLYADVAAARAELQFRPTAIHLPDQAAFARASLLDGDGQALRLHLAATGVRIEPKARVLRHPGRDGAAGGAERYVVAQ